MDEYARIRPASSEAAKPSSGGGEAVSRTPVVDSEDLLQGGRELQIIHQGQVYRLRLTQNNKLILQK
jgi:hemin uptake protein HemP